MHRDRLAKSRERSKSKALKKKEDCASQQKHDQLLQEHHSFETEIRKVRKINQKCISMFGT